MALEKESTSMWAIAKMGMGKLQPGSIMSTFKLACNKKFRGDK